MSTLSERVVGLSHLFINSQYDLFERYTKDMEESLTNIEIDLMNRYEQITKDYSEQEIDEFWDFHIDDHNDVNKEYPNLLRSNSLINAYSYYEKSLIENHTLLKRTVVTVHFPNAKDLKSSAIKRMDGSVIEKIKACFEDINFPFPTGTEWAEILKYKEVRNNIVHNGGIVETPSDLTSDIMLAINSLNHVSVSPNSGRIIFEEQFSFDVYNTMRDFYELFFTEIRNYKKNHSL